VPSLLTIGLEFKTNLMIFKRCLPGNSNYCYFVDGMAFDADNYTFIGVNNKTI